MGLPAIQSDPRHIVPVKLRGYRKGEACSRDTAAQNKVELGECIVRVVVARLSVADDVLDNEARALRAELRCMNDLSGPAPTNQDAAPDCRQEPTVA